MLCMLKSAARNNLSMRPHFATKISIVQRLQEKNDDLLIGLTLFHEIFQG